MSENNILGIGSVKEEDIGAYKENNGAYDAAKEMGVTNYYDSWAKNGTYEEALCPGRYNGPEIAAKVIEKYFGNNKDKTNILDVASGTGLVAEQLLKRGFKRMDALEPSEAMMDLAVAKNIYTNHICDYLNSVETSVKSDTYDVVVNSGGMGEGHIPTVSLVEMIRVVKPGGCVIIVMRAEFLDYVAEYFDRLEPFMKQLADKGWWTREERTTVPKYSFSKDGLVFVYRVHRSEAPSADSIDLPKQLVSQK